MKKFNRHQIFSAAWRMFRKGVPSFALALRLAWRNAKTTLKAKEAAGISEESHSWAAWRDMGYMVIHESKSVFRAILEDPATRSGQRTVCYFTRSQVEPIAV